MSSTRQTFGLLLFASVLTASTLEAMPDNEVVALVNEINRTLDAANGSDRSSIANFHSGLIHLKRAADNIDTLDGEVSRRSSVYSDFGRDLGAMRSYLLTRFYLVWKEYSRARSVTDGAPSGDPTAKDIKTLLDRDPIVGWAQRLGRLLLTGAGGIPSAPPSLSLNASASRPVSSSISIAPADVTNPLPSIQAKGGESLFYNDMNPIRSTRALTPSRAQMSSVFSTSNGTLSSSTLSGSSRSALESLSLAPRWNSDIRSARLARPAPQPAPSLAIARAAQARVQAARETYSIYGASSRWKVAQIHSLGRRPPQRVAGFVRKPNRNSAIPLRYRRFIPRDEGAPRGINLPQRPYYCLPYQPRTSTGLRSLGETWSIFDPKPSKSIF